jgi:elongation factor Ts
MAAITAADIAKLREETGLGMMECKKYLTAAGGDLAKAKEDIRKAGVKASVTERAASEGYIFFYSHKTTGKLGVMVELRCNTDFAAKSDDFQRLGNDIALHIAGVSPAPLAVRREDIPAELVAKEKEIAAAQVPPGKPANIVEKIVEGKLNTFFAERVLLEQPFVKDPAGKTKVQDLVNDLIKKTGENVQIARFARFEVGK